MEMTNGMLLGILFARIVAENAPPRLAVSITFSSAIVVAIVLPCYRTHHRGPPLRDIAKLFRRLRLLFHRRPVVRHEI